MTLNCNEIFKFFEDFVFSKNQNGISEYFKIKFIEISQEIQFLKIKNGF